MRVEFSFYLSLTNAAQLPQYVICHKQAIGDKVRSNLVITFLRTIAHYYDTNKSIIF